MVMTISRIIAACLALSAFAVSVIAGVAAGNDASLVLTRAMIAMILCYPVGFIVGIVCERVVEWHVAAHVVERPVPHGDGVSSVGAAAAGESGDEDEEVITV
jgi:hypothetical protein